MYCVYFRFLLLFTIAVFLQGSKLRTNVYVYKKGKYSSMLLAR